MHYKTCEICGIKSGRLDGQKRIFMAKFPLDEDRCKQWLKVTGKEDLVYIPIEKLHQLKHICGNHFLSKNFKKKKTQLRKNAVPSVRLSAEPLADELLIGFPLHIAKTDQTVSMKCSVDHTYARNTHIEHSYSQITGSASIKVARITVNELSQQPEEAPLLEADGISDTSSISDLEALKEESIAVPQEETFSWLQSSETIQVTEDPIDIDEENLSMYDNTEEPTPFLSEVNNEDENSLHVGYHCDVCNGEIKGFRYTCVQCSDLDLCGACEATAAHNQHYVLRVPQHRPYAEIQLVLSRIRRHLMKKLDPIAEPDPDLDDLTSIKLEVKSEDEDDDARKEMPDKNDNIGNEDAALIDEDVPVDSTDCTTESSVTEQTHIPHEDLNVSNEVECTSNFAKQTVSEQTQGLPPPSNVKKRLLVKLDDFMRIKPGSSAAKQICLLRLPTGQLPEEIHCEKIRTVYCSNGPQKSVQCKMKPVQWLLQEPLNIEAQDSSLQSVDEYRRKYPHLDNR